MKRSPFRPSMSRLKRTRLERKSGLVSKKPTRKLRRVGNNKHSRDWAREWSSLKREFERAGITFCEGGFEGCWKTNALTPAHSLKRRHITNKTEMREVAILCIPCHNRLELIGEAQMHKMIQQIIERRAFSHYE